MRASILASLAGHLALGAALPAENAFNPRQAGASAYASNSGGNLQLSSVAAPVQGAGSTGSESSWNLSIDGTSSGHKQTIIEYASAS
jgi:glucosylceramidase